MSEQHRDPVTIAPHVYRVLFENDRVRMLEVTIKPGDKSAMHYHPDAMVYLLTGGKLRMTTPEGSMEGDMPSSTSVWQAAGSHAVENIGDTEMKGIMVELKS